ncbi:MAG TPA: sigma-70 family RNA polymerase sigma factor [Chloroflexia bacterium]|nr:sigma-70 family RNA polymerase sigma factor [Chloroflexia bacterium]
MIASFVKREAALVAAAQADPGAFADLYHLYYPAIYRFAQRHTGDPVQAEDIAADTFLAALKALPHYEWRGIPFSAWLYRIAATVIAGQHRRNHGIAYVPLEHSLFPWSEPVCDDPGPDACLEQWEQHQRERDLLRGALRRLTCDQRQAILLRYGGLDLRPLAEVAARMNRSEGAVKLLLHRGVAALRRAMIDREHGCQRRAQR